MTCPNFMINKYLELTQPTLIIQVILCVAPLFYNATIMWQIEI